MRQFVLWESSFLWMKGDSGCLYNTKKHTSLRFSVVDPFIHDVCRQWDEPSNLYAAKFDENKVSEVFFSFAANVEERSLGQIFEEDEAVISYPPILSIQDSVERLHKTGVNLINEPVLKYLLCLRIFLGGNTDKRSWWLQAMYPMNSSARLEADRILQFLRRCDLNSINHIDLLISDWDKEQIDSFIKAITLLDISGKTRFFFTHPDPSYNNEVLDSLLGTGLDITQVCLPGNEKTFPVWISGRSYCLLVRNEVDYNHWETLLEQESPDNYTIKPIAEDNIDFFRANVFLSEEDILGQKLSKKDIFRHQALNVNQFGTLFVFPDGTIHSAPDGPTIGTLEDSVHQTIVRELEENHSWRQTRKLMSPCKDCIYQDLCPSPSVYERILGTPACTIKES